MKRTTLLCLICLIVVIFGGSVAACTEREPTDTMHEQSTVTEPESHAPTAPEMETDLITDVLTDAPTDTETLTEPLTETPTETEPKTPAETIDYTVYTPQYTFMDLFDTSSTSVSDMPISAKRAAGIHLEIAQGCFLSTLTFTCPSYGNNTGSMDVVFYRWNTDYETTVNSEAVFTYTVSDRPDNASVTIYLPAHTIGSGEWYFEFRNGTEDAIGVWVSRGEPVSDPYIRTVMGYINGRGANRFVGCDVTYVRYDVEAEASKPIDPAKYTQLSEGKTHVIVLTGQSNAAGQTLSSFLKETISAEDYAMYEKGFDHILIDVHPNNGIANGVCTNGFVPVRLGQGTYEDRFGIEVGLAAYLSKHYPGETFYIIKSGFSGSGLATNWQEGQNNCHGMFVENMERSLKRLTDMGLEPEIFAFLWMQGETDASSVDHASRYGELTEDLIERMSNRYAEYVSPGGFAFVDAAVCDRAIWPYANRVNMFKLQCVGQSQNRYFIDTNTPDIDCRDENNDPAHYDSDDMIELGTLFGEAVGQILENAKKARN